MYKVLIKPLIKEKVLYFRELVGILSWVYFAFTPILGEALAIFFFGYGFVGGLSLFEKKVIFRLK
jgi:hypothetical protein